VAGQDVVATVQDQRSALEKALWHHVGPPLYYCQGCLRAVRVELAQDPAQPPVITRPCQGCQTEQIIAPRKAIAAGEGGLNWGDRVRVSWWQLAAAATGRCV